MLRSHTVAVVVFLLDRRTAVSARAKAVWKTVDLPWLSFGSRKMGSPLEELQPILPDCEPQRHNQPSLSAGVSGLTVIDIQQVVA